MQRCRLWGAGLQISTSCDFWKLLGTMFILCMLIMSVSALTTQSEELTMTAENCQFRGKHYKGEYRLQGEPVVMKCPLVQFHVEASASSHTFLTWSKNNSAQLVPGEEPRMWAEENALWILPSLLEDSGTYICTLRNASHCAEMSMELRVFGDIEASLPRASYTQVIGLSDSGMLVCPDLMEFFPNKTGVTIQWYKGLALLDQNNEKFLHAGNPMNLLITNVSLEDAGYYRCATTFAHKGKEYNITRSIELRVIRRSTEAIPVIISPLDTVSASVGSRLTVPCKVFLGAGTSFTTMVWWLANSTDITFAYPEGRVTEGPYREYSENDENYMEVSLIFDPVIKEDLYTDFQCVARNLQNYQTLHAVVKEATSTFSWGIALAPLSLVFLVLGGIWMHRQCKHRAGNPYGLIKLKTGHLNFPFYPRKIKEMT